MHKKRKGIIVKIDSPELTWKPVVIKEINTWKFWKRWKTQIGRYIPVNTLVYFVIDERNKIISVWHREENEMIRSNTRNSK